MREPFVGRHRELAHLRSAVDDVVRGGARIVTVSGDAGIGKTRIVEELAAYAGGRGYQVFWGRCHEADAIPAYWPWVQVLRSALRGRDATWTREHALEIVPYFSHAVPELRRMTSETAPPVPSRQESSRFYLFAALASFMTSLSLRQPLMVILDDLHWADVSSLLVRDSVGDAVLAEYNAVNDAFDAMLHDLDPSSLDTPCYDLRGVATVADFLDLRVMELVLHGWDLRSRLEHESHLSAESSPALARVITRSFQWLYWPGSTEAPVHYRFDVAELQPRLWDVFIEGSHARLANGSGCPADVAIGCDGESFFLLMFGRLSASDVRTAGRITVDGNETQADMLDQWFRGF